MLIGKGLAVGGVEGDVLRRAVEGGAEFEQLAIGAPAGALLSFGAEIPQVGNGFLPKGLGVFRGIHQHIHQTVEALVAEDRERLAEFLEGADAPAEEVAVSQFHHTAVDETVVELLAIFLAAAEGANEFTHGDLSLGDSTGFVRTGGLGVALGDVALKHLAVGGADDFCFFCSGQTGTHFKQLASL